MRTSIVNETQLGFGDRNQMTMAQVSGIAIDSRVTLLSMVLSCVE